MTRRKSRVVLVLLHISEVEGKLSRFVSRLNCLTAPVQWWRVNEDDEVSLIALSAQRRLTGRQAFTHEVEIGDGWSGKSMENLYGHVFLFVDIPLDSKFNSQFTSIAKRSFLVTSCALLCVHHVHELVCLLATRLTLFTPLLQRQYWQFGLSWKGFFSCTANSRLQHAHDLVQTIFYFHWSRELCNSIPAAH